MSKLLWGLVKYLLFSLLVSVFTLIAAISVSTGKFPPSWQQILGFRKNIEAILVLKKQLTENGGLSQLQAQFPKMALPVGSKNSGKVSDAMAGEYSDPALADVNEIIRHRQQQAALSETISGEAHFGSLTPPSESAPAKAAVDSEVTERVRKLEDLVAHMHAQIQRLNKEIAVLKQTQNRH